MGKHAQIISQVLDYKQSGTMIGRDKILTLMGKHEDMIRLLDGIESCERRIANLKEQRETFPHHADEFTYQISNQQQEITVKAVAYKSLMLDATI